MKKSRRIEITISSRRTVTLKGHPRVIRKWCDGCDAEVWMLTVETAPTLTNGDPRSIHRALEKAAAVKVGSAADAPMTIALVLKRSNQAGFEHYFYDVYDPHSSNFHHFLNPTEISDRFGPSPDSYDAVLQYLQRNGLEVIQGSANRLTITVRGTRSQVNHAFGIQ